jgi:YegS/Rv2252/BmrU family lipid kinase
MEDMKAAFVVLNPVAGNSDVGAVRQAFEHHLSAAGWTYTVYETTGEESVADVVRGALDQGFDLFVAAGGDGTVSGVVGGLVHTSTPLAIVPVGTGNTLARELGVPLDVEGAVELLVSEHAVADIDALQVGDRFFVLNVGTGMSALMMRDTRRRDKRRLGLIAYLWTGLKTLLGLQPHRFTVVTDGWSAHLQASELMVVNSGALGDPNFRWGSQIRMDDGQLEVCVVRARNLLDYLEVAWGLLTGRQERAPQIRCLRTGRSATISADEPLPVQADGEVIGQTPMEVRIVPGGVRVVVPVHSIEVSES